MPTTPRHGAHDARRRKDEGASVWACTPTRTSGPASAPALQSALPKRPQRGGARRALLYLVRTVLALAVVGGMAFGTSAEDAAEVTKAVMSVTKKPIFMKLSPNVTDIVGIAKACEDAGAAGISMINTLLGMRIDINKRKPVLANKMGGYSGPAIFPVALRMVYQVARAVNIPIIGMGGISSSDDVIEMMMAGATAVQIGAANLVNPYVCKEIIEDLPDKMKALGIQNLNEIIGVVK